jgi:hypothetical protein
VEDSSSDHPPGNQGEEALDLVPPRTAARGEVEVETLSFLRLQLSLHVGAFRVL